MCRAPNELGRPGRGREVDRPGGWRYVCAMSESTTDRLLRGLRARGSGIRRVRYRENRSVLLSVSRDGRTLNSHACFREAPDGVLAAIVEFLTSRRRSAASRRALETLREWEGAREGLERARRRRPRRRAGGLNGAGTEPVRSLFHQFNRTRFGGALPDIGIRVSRRMTRTLGTIAYGTEGGRSVREIAISADLLLPENRAVLEDTLLHEMAHAEAWLEHGHRGHGAVWRRVAKRVGCTPRALTRTRIHRARR